MNEIKRISEIYKSMNVSEASINEDDMIEQVLTEFKSDLKTVSPNRMGPSIASVIKYHIQFLESEGVDLLVSELFWKHDQTEKARTACKKLFIELVTEALSQHR